MRENKKVFINGETYTKPAFKDNKGNRDSNDPHDIAYSSLSNHYRSATPEQRYTFAMLSNYLNNDSDFEGFNFSTARPSTEDQEPAFVQGYYSQKDNKAHVYVGEGSLLNPIRVANHEGFHGLMDARYQKTRNPKTNEKSLPANTLDNYFRNNKSDFDDLIGFGQNNSGFGLTNSLLTTIKNAQNIVDPKGGYAEYYPVNNIRLFNNDTLQKSKNLRFNLPEEMATYALDRIGDRQSFVSSKTDKHANNLVKQTLQNSKDQFGRLYTDGFKKYPVVEASFDRALDEINSPYKYKNGGYVTSSPVTFPF